MEEELTPGVVHRVKGCKQGFMFGGRAWSETEGVGHKAGSGAKGCRLRSQMILRGQGR